MSEEKYWLGFNMVKGIGSAKVRALLDRFGSLATAWHAPIESLKQLGFDKRAINNLVAARDALDLDFELAKIKRADVKLLTWEGTSPTYPELLHKVIGSPPSLYMKGEILPADKWAVAVVGTRKITSYGKQVTREIVSGLVNSGVTIVSGLAKGVDSVAHETAVSLGGRTIAVLGSGLNHIYPSTNRGLAQRIVSGQGAVITEHAFDVKPEAKNFPPRNRIISGLSLGTVVIEAGEKSGALITSTFAMEQNRDVFAVPGPINSPMSAGPNKLIQEGAKLIRSADDVLQELNLTMVPEQSAVQMMMPESAEEAAVLNQLSRTPTHIDEISRGSQLETAVVTSTLTMMELKGMVQRISGVTYVRLREPVIKYKVGSE